MLISQGTAAQGHDVSLFLDAQTRSKVEVSARGGRSAPAAGSGGRWPHHPPARAPCRRVQEFSVANFLAVAADGSVVSPASPSILPSCTRQVVLRIARELGLRAEERDVPWTEVRTLREAAACGTAVVLTPMASITRGEEVVTFDGHATIQRLYDAVVETQTGVRPDTLGLLHEVEL